MMAQGNRILFILHLPPPVHGAAMMGSYLKQCKGLNEQFECRYVNLTSASDLTDIGKASFSKILKYFRLLWNVRKEVKCFSPDLVYITPNACAPAFYKDFLMVQILKMMGSPVVAYYHNKGVATRQNHSIDNFLYKSFFKSLKLILLSDRIYPDVQKYVSLNDVYFCPNGIPNQEIVNTDNHNSIPQMLFLSNLLVSKGVYVLLDALHILRERNLRFICHFVGGETKEISKDKLQQEILKRRLDDVVFYHGSKTGLEKNIFLDEADLFVFPTYSDCFPLVLLEAMQHGLPCVSTDEGAIASIIEEGKTGFVVEKGNPRQLAQKLELLLQDENLRKFMGQAGKKKFEEEYTLDIFEKRMVEVFHQIINTINSHLYNTK